MLTLFVGGWRSSTAAENYDEGSLFNKLLNDKILSNNKVTLSFLVVAACINLIKNS